jgi:hypothetical protein
MSSLSANSDEMLIDKSSTYTSNMITIILKNIKSSSEKSLTIPEDVKINGDPQILSISEYAKNYRYPEILSTSTTISDDISNETNPIDHIVSISDNTQILVRDFKDVLRN